MTTWPPDAAGKACVLLVDDDRLVLEALTLVLSDLYQVVGATSAAQALTILEVARVDLIILDYCLPDRPGTDVVRIVKHEHPSLPVVIITGYGSETLCTRLFRLGISDYLSKPYDVDELLATVRRLLGTPGGDQPRPRRILPHDPSVLSFASPHPGIQRALSWIHANYTRAIRLKEVAAVAAMSRFHFCRVFKAEVGLSFRQYVTRLRVERVKELLRESRKSVTDVALEVGFFDLSHLYRAFRRSTGRSPCAWRRTALSGTLSNFDIRESQERPRR